MNTAESKEFSYTLSETITLMGLGFMINIQHI
jgi:hypothetical protein